MPISYAAAVSNPNGNQQRPRVQPRKATDYTCSPFTITQEPSVKAQSEHTYANSESKPQDALNSRHLKRGLHNEPSPNTYHKPKTDGKEHVVYVLTVRMTSSVADPINKMRERYFPKHLNRTPAHLTLFHALPHSKLNPMDDTLKTLSSRTKPFNISTGRAFRMRRGVGIGLYQGARETKAVHDDLKTAWLDWLSEQDSGGWRPHWTVMNKVDKEEEVAEAFDAIQRDLLQNAVDGRAVGLDLWTYDKGDWRWAKEFRFSGDGAK
ncbi:2'-5' RNA ligase superfamily-domain-containing protein [Massariosphaeria phaeospora]|uniref:2'-5' RNA ligase superfamily-domain-containing protein n=1 Tax=Massariosphaeria phaeospora TaxID=100035 RepID=A0A7C8MC14_9PLEO|nr:2'-5' RNA ligase superfamily-domain-containing protein [Massariosphaeria phaeospora]